jgi:CSLREA domain-containing protein
MYFSWHKIAALGVFSLSLACFPVAADTFTVDTTADADLSACTASPNDCSLRGALNRANANSVPDTVAFSIPGSGFKTLVPATALPTLTDPQTFIDGNSQPGYNGLPLIVLSGAQIPAPALANGLHITTSGCRIRGLTLYGWENAIAISGALGVNNQVEGCLIGTDVLGRSVPSSTNNTGIAIKGSAQDNTIGGRTTAERNVISANRAQGVLIADQGTTLNKIWGNYIGTDRYGNALGEMEQRNGVGVALQNNTSNNAIGGDSGAGNLISGNRMSGVHLHTANGNGIYGNRIGTDATGQKAIGNGPLGSSLGFGSGSGIYLYFSESCFIGSGSIGDRNIISGHAGHGIMIVGSSNTVAANYIGLDITGTKALGNLNGIAMLNNGSTNNVIGGPGTGNVISGNGVGIITDSFSSDQPFSGHHLIEGNLIGTNARGTAAVPNQIGISLRQTSDNRIGRPLRASRNLISGNSEANLHLFRANRNLIEGNFIGTNSSGSAPLGNFSTVAGISVVISRANQIGGPSIEARNIISGHAGHGIFISGSSNNAVQNNYIGVDATGTKAVPNGKDGILMDLAPENTIGGTLRNVISGNLGHGISIIGSHSGANTVAGNFIGLNARGDGVLGNGAAGILINQGAQRCTIGSTDIALRNVISANADGVVIQGTGITAHTIINCYIGTDATGNKPGFGNKEMGISISGAHENRIGVPGAPRNVVSGNSWSNIAIRSSNRNTIQNNFIGPKANGNESLLPYSDQIFVGYGISIQGDRPNDIISTGNLIGGTQSGARNVISGNQYVGIFNFASVSNTVIQGNFIGTNAAGDTAVPNAYAGLLDSGDGTLIGGTTPQARNVISGNGVASRPGSYGILAGGFDSKVQGNFIGTNARGTAALPNLFAGVAVVGSGVTVGGITSRPGTGAGNLISGNVQHGVTIDSSPSSSSVDARVADNLIGTDATGTKAVPNGAGITLYGGGGTFIGNGAPSGRNIISGNSGPGIQSAFSQSTSRASSTRIQGNYIGTNISGQAALPNLNGIQLSYSIGTIIGGSTTRPGTGAGNLISGNRSAGIATSEQGFTIFVYGNAIGVAADGTTPLPNTSVNGVGGWGLHLESAALNIGAPGELSNLIAHNEAAGIAVGPNGRSEGYSIRGNRIFNNGGLGIDLGDDGPTLNDTGDVDSGPNSLQNFPILTQALQNEPGAPLVLSGTFDSTADRQFAIDVYASSTPDPSGHGEGQTYLGSFNISTSGGAVNFNRSIDVDVDLSGKFISLTASDVDYPQTSEFSQVVAVNAAPIGADNTAVDEPSQ